MGGKGGWSSSDYHRQFGTAAESGASQPARPTPTREVERTSKPAPVKGKPADLRERRAGSAKPAGSAEPGRTALSPDLPSEPCGQPDRRPVETAADTITVTLSPEDQAALAAMAAEAGTDPAHLAASLIHEVLADDALAHEDAA